MDREFLSKSSCQQTYTLHCNANQQNIGILAYNLHMHAHAHMHTPHTHTHAHMHTPHTHTHAHKHTPHTHARAHAHTHTQRLHLAPDR